MKKATPPEAGVTYTEPSWLPVIVPPVAAAQNSASRAGSVAAMFTAPKVSEGVFNGVEVMRPR